MPALQSPYNHLRPGRAWGRLGAHNGFLPPRVMPAGARRWRLQIDVSRTRPGSDPPLGAADAAVAAWEEIRRLLAPVIGQGGVAALYKRSLRLTIASRPWLAPAYGDGPLQAGELAALHSALAAQDGAVAAAASRELLANFRAVLTSLVGEALTAKLLAARQRASPDGEPAKEPLP
jgi:hypothetical protein